ncbi:MAG: hypothetical protein JOS17DRAFT_134928 [Linnemannia elongata]|nr:MAG: hypothetical protein JOS17DRAFT_134928 [Linnemannia elongata]
MLPTLGIHSLERLNATTTIHIDLIKANYRMALCQPRVITIAVTLAINTSIGQPRDRFGHWIDSNRRLSLPAGAFGNQQSTINDMIGQPGCESHQLIHQAGMQPGHRPSQTAHDITSQPTTRSPHGNKDGGMESVSYQQNNDDSMTVDVEERDDRVQNYSRYHGRGQITGIRREERDEENRTMEGIQDASSRQREAIHASTNRLLSRASEEGQERMVTPGSLGEASEPTVNISRSLSVDVELPNTDLLYMGRRANRNSEPLSRPPGTIAGEGVDLRGQQLLSDSQKRNQDESLQGSMTNLDDSQYVRGGAVETDSSFTRESPSVLFAFADTAARLGDFATTTLLSNGSWSNLDLSFGESASVDRDVAQKDPRRLPTRTNGVSFVLGQAGYYTRRDLEALFAVWEERCLSSRGARVTNNLRPEIEEGSKSKGRKLVKSRDVRTRKGSRSSLQDESNNTEGFEEEDESDDDDDDDEYETEGDKDEADENKRRAEGASGSSKRKRLLPSKHVTKSKGKGKVSLESDGKKRKKLKSVEDTKKHACSKCGKRFSRPSQRDTHYLTHTGQVKPKRRS